MAKRGRPSKQYDNPEFRSWLRRFSPSSRKKRIDMIMNGARLKNKERKAALIKLRLKATVVIPRLDVVSAMIRTSKLRSTVTRQPIEEDDEVQVCGPLPDACTREQRASSHRSEGRSADPGNISDEAIVSLLPSTRTTQDEAAATAFGDAEASDERVELGATEELLPSLPTYRYGSLQLLQLLQPFPDDVQGASGLQLDIEASPSSPQLAEPSPSSAEVEALLEAVAALEPEALPFASELEASPPRPDVDALIAALEPEASHRAPELEAPPSVQDVEALLAALEAEVPPPAPELGPAPFAPALGTTSSALEPTSSPSSRGASAVGPSKDSEGAAVLVPVAPVAPRQRLPVCEGGSLVPSALLQPRPPPGCRSCEQLYPREPSSITAVHRLAAVTVSRVSFAPRDVVPAVEPPSTCLVNSLPYDQGHPRPSGDALHFTTVCLARCVYEVETELLMLGKKLDDFKTLNFGDRYLHSVEALQKCLQELNKQSTSILALHAQNSGKSWTWPSDSDLLREINLGTPLTIYSLPRLRTIIHLLRNLKDIQRDTRSLYRVFVLDLFKVPSGQNYTSETTCHSYH